MPIKSNWARLAFLILGVLWVIAGWWITLDGSLMMSTDKHGHHSVLVEGAGAILMAFVFHALATSCALIIIESYKKSVMLYVIAATIILGVPAIYTLAK